MKEHFFDRVRALFGRRGAPSAANAPPFRDAVKSARPARQEPPLPRLTLAQWLWGEGFVTPGDAAFVLGLVKPFGLTPAMSMLDLSAGLGGPARAIAQTYGTYVTGLERSPELARLGMAMSTAANLAKRAAIVQYDPETVELRPHAFDCVLARGATCRVADKERLLRVLHGGMKPRGQLLINELTIAAAAGDGREVAAWTAKEPYPAALWTLEQYRDCLAGLGFDIRVTEDITDSYRHMVIGGWARLLNEIDLKAMPKSHRLTIIDEVEVWARRVATLEGGGLRVFRIYALVDKPAR